MVAIEQLIHRPVYWDRVWHFEIIASTGDCAGEADKQKTSANETLAGTGFMLGRPVDPRQK